MVGTQKIFLLLILLIGTQSFLAQNFDYERSWGTPELLIGDLKSLPASLL